MWEAFTMVLFSTAVCVTTAAVKRALKTAAHIHFMVHLFLVRTKTSKEIKPSLLNVFFAGLQAQLTHKSFPTHRINSIIYRKLHDDSVEMIELTKMQVWRNKYQQ